MKNGIIAICKPEGISSARVVARVKRALGAKKVGHTGTLDPFATGLILCAVNKGTKISRFFLSGRKRYTARICLGKETDTYDRTGKTVSSVGKEEVSSLTSDEITTWIKSFSGIQFQVPPAFSALKHEGRPLYALAREGIKIEKPPRKIEIFKISVKRITLPYVDVDVLCSAGTYIRSIAFDLGRKLGCGAHLSQLCRTGSSAFTLEDAMELSAFEKLAREAAWEKIIPLSDCLGFMPCIIADRSMAKKIQFGQKLEIERDEWVAKDPDAFIRVVDEENSLLAIVQSDENRQIFNYCCVFSA